MSTKGGTYKGHRFHGDPQRFEVVADFVFKTFKRDITYIADVAGGRGMLSRLLNKKYNYEAEVIDPRGFTLKGVQNKAKIFNPNMASYYDLVIGLHPDEATRAIAEAAHYTNTLLIPCCNFWDSSKKLGTIALVNEIEQYYKENRINFEKSVLEFEGPKNIALTTYKKRLR